MEPSNEHTAMNKHKNEEWDFSQQLDQIAYMLNVRTKGKKYENFIVNAIYVKVGEPNLKPVTQQLVHDPDDFNKLYYVDLYFPQLNIAIEVDEAYHEDETQQLRDKEREDKIKRVLKCNYFERIQICKDKVQGINYSYQEVCNQIDRVVAIIKNQISQLKTPLKWERYQDILEEVKQRGFFDTEDKYTYNSITDIYNICGGKRSGAGGEATRLQRCCYKLNNQYKLWVPILSIDDSGHTIKSKMGFKNTLSPDKTILKMECDHKKNLTRDKDYKRVVFMRMKDNQGRLTIKFFGVYKLADNDPLDSETHYFERVQPRIEIKDLK